MARLRFQAMRKAVTASTAVASVIFFSCVAIGMFSQPAAGGILDGVRSGVRSGGSDSSSSDHDSSDHRYDHHGHGHDDDDEDDGSDFLGSLLGSILEGILSGDDNHHHHHNGHHDQGDGFNSSGDVLTADLFYTRYPYADGYDGFLMNESWTPVDSRTWSGRIDFEFGSDFDSLDRYHGGLFLESCSGWGIEFDWNHYQESLAGGMTDQLDLSELNLMFRIISGEQFTMRLGGGVNWLSDSIGTESGWNLTTQADYFPIQPLVVSADLDWGTIGDADLFHTSITAGVMIRRFEFFAGYDYRRIGSTDLDGPIFGVRVWF